MKTNRRDFLRASAAAGAGTVFFMNERGKVRAQAPVGSPRLQKFVQPVPLFGVNIPLAQGGGSVLNAANVKKDQYGADYYRIMLGQYTQKMHPNMPKATKLWGYADATLGTPKFQYLGAPILAVRDTPVRIKYQNLLPSVHPLPVDTSLPGAETGQLQNRAAIHLHGGHVPWVSDGGPFHWIAPNGTKGPSNVNWLPDPAGRPTNDLWYPNDDRARFMWYHDHAVGITRLNAYAGLATGYLLLDQDEIASGIPLAGIVLVLQDKQFKQVADRWGSPGDLWYPDAYGPPDGPASKPMPYPSCVPEFFGDTTVINGAVCPYLRVKPTLYRFRLLNGTQARFYNLRLFEEKQDASGNWTGRITTDPTPNSEAGAVPGPDMLLIGMEGGFLPAPVLISNIVPTGIEPSTGFPYHLLLGGAERADLLIDFTGIPGGTRFILYNNAPGPFPEPSNPLPIDAPYASPDTANLLEIIIDSQGGVDHSLFNKPAGSFQIPTLARTPLVSANPPFVKSLHEITDPYGRLIQLIGPGSARYYLDAPTDIGAPGEVQTWDVYNTTGDVHPIHVHLFNVQIVGRAAFSGLETDVGVYSDPAATISYLNDDALTPPDPTETGWKETIKMYPGTMVRLRAKFDHPPAPVAVPDSPRFAGYHEYVWHCHILEHEEHDMMRPLLVSTV